MSIPDFGRAEYVEPRVIEGEVVGAPLRRGSSNALPLAILYGAVAAVVGSIGYGLVASTGFMISIVAIGIGWLVARAMMTATGGIGGRPFQIAAVVLTYLSVTAGGLLHPLYGLYRQGVPVGRLLEDGFLLKYLLLGPFLDVGRGLNGIIGLLILFFGLRAAWRMAAGSPGFGNAGGPRMTPFGPR